MMEAWEVVASEESKNVAKESYWVFLEGVSHKMENGERFILGFYSLCEIVHLGVPGV